MVGLILRLGDVRVEARLDGFLYERDDSLERFPLNVFPIEPDLEITNKAIRLPQVRDAGLYRFSHCAYLEGGPLSDPPVPVHTTYPRCHADEKAVLYHIFSYFNLGVPLHLPVGGPGILS